jgi:glycosyltransferase 2 family protein
MQKTGKKLLITISIGAIIYIAFAIWADYSELLNAFREINWLFIPLILLLVLVNYILRFLKWHYYLGILNIKIDYNDSFFIFFSGLSMSITPGKMGELLKCYLLKKIKKTSMSYSSPIIIAERITDFISLIVIAIIGVYYIDYGRMIIIGFGIVFLALVLILSSKKISIGIISILENIKFLEKYVKKIHVAYESIYILIKIKPLILMTILSLVGWFSECFGVFLIFKSFSSDQNISVLLSSFIYAFSTLVGVVSPGGLFITDASLAGLLTTLGRLVKNYAVASTIIIRAVTLWFAVIIGSIALLYYQRKIHIHLTDIENIEKE